MRLRLDDLGLEGLDLDLPAAAGTGGQQAKVRSATGLRGGLAQSPGELRLEGVHAQAIVLDALRLDFGAVVVTEEGEALLEAVECGFEQRGGETHMEIGAAVVEASRLCVDVGDVHVGGQAHMRGMRVAIHGAEGCFEAESLALATLELRIGELALEAEDVRAARLHVSWGAAGFRLELTGLVGRALSLRAGPVTVEGNDLEVARVLVHEGHVVVGELALGRARLDARLEPSPASAASSGEKRAPSLDGRLLDGLSGEVNVDLRVDLAVPILGRRRATHRFRVPLAEGSLDFRELEGDLSTLENALLDFAVRDRALVLERGIPFLPTRGRGTPILVWDLAPDDLARAQRNRVRLAVLPGVRLAAEASADERKEGAGSSPIALRELGLEQVDVRLRLASPATPRDGVLPTLAFEGLTLEGSLTPVAEGGPRPGELRGRVDGLRATVAAVPLGSQRLRVERLRVARIGDVRAAFRGAALDALGCELSALALEELELGAEGDLAR